MYPTFADLLADLQKLSPDQLQQPAMVYDDWNDEFRSVFWYKEKVVGTTDSTCESLPPGHPFIFI